MSELKVAVMMAEGYEEGESLTIIDLLRRAGITAHTFSLRGAYVKGMQNMEIKADKIFSDEIKDYDMIVLPGGRPGGANLAASEAVLNMIRYFNDNDKFVTAMCSGTTVLEKAGIINGRDVTGYVGYASKLPSGNFKDEVVVQDGKLITSQGPATAYPFALKLVEALGKQEEADIIRYRTMYTFAGGK